MTKKKYNILEKKVFDYINSFIGPDNFINKNINLKKCHTKRVCLINSELVSNMNFSDKEFYISKSIALLHDIGRFKQFSLYKTFLDYDSEDHAELGLNVIEEEKFLKNLPLNSKETIVEAIKYHNKHLVPASIKKSHSKFIKIIRDADKLDILYILSDYYKNRKNDKNEALEMNLSDEPFYSDDIINNILEEKTSSNKIRKTIYDMMLNHAAWIFDLNFKFSIKYIKEKKYLDIIFSELPADKTINKVKNHIDAYIEKKLNEQG